MENVMKIDLNNLVSITEANQNFSKVARLVDEKGAAVILKNNKPKYVLIEYDNMMDSQIADETVAGVASNIIKRNIKAFQELAK